MRRFEFRDQKSSKFWAIERSGSEVITRWGRIDSKGQSASKDFGDPAKAASEVDKQIRSKTGKGYVEVAGAEPAAGASKPTPSEAASVEPASVPMPTEPVEPTPAREPKAARDPKPEAADANSDAAVPDSTPAAASNDIPDGGEVVVAGSGSSKYTLRNVGGAYSCTCPAWLHQSLPAERRTCKHLRKFRGEAAEEARMGGRCRSGRSPPARARP